MKKNKIGITFFLLLILIILFISCKKEKCFISFDQKILNAQKQGLAFSLNYLGKDTLKILSISAVDSLHIYRLTVNDPSGMLPTYNYYLDSSNDGGQSWSKKILILHESYSGLFELNQVERLYVSDKRNKYIITSQGIYAASKTINFHQITDFFLLSYSQGFTFNKASDELKFISIQMRVTPIDSLNLYFNRPNPYTLKIIKDTSIRLVELDQSFTENLATYISPFNDTLYIALKKDQNMILRKLNYNTFEKKEVKLPNQQLSDLDFSILADNNYLAILVHGRKIPSMRVRGQNAYESKTFNYYFSHDFGNNWDSSNLPVNSISSIRDFYNQHLFSYVDENASQNIAYKNFYLSTFNNSEFYLTDSFMVSDSIKSLDYLPNSPDLYFIGTDSNERYNYLFSTSITSANNLSVLKSYQINETPDKINVIIKITKGRSLYKYLSFKLYGASDYYYKHTNNYIFLTDKFLPNEDSTIWKASFEREKLDLINGDKYHLHIFFSDNTKESQIDLIETYTPTSFYEQHSSLIIALIVIICYTILVISLLYISPLTLYRIDQRIPVKELIASSPLILKVPLSILNLLFPISYLTTTRYVLNAWLNTYNNVLKQQFKSSNTVENRKEDDYISIPLKLYHSTTNDTKNISSPDSTIPKGFIRNKRILIQIIGEGGIGKTTLGIQLCRWMIASKENNKKQIPFIVDFDTTDITGCIIDKFRAWIPEEKINRDFVEALIKNKNIILLIDALSEQSLTMQQYINDIHSKIECNALIVTTRRKFIFQNIDNFQIYPLALTPDKLLYFITNYIESKNKEEGDVVKINAHQQIQLASKIVDILEDMHGSVSVTPMLVKLVIDSFFDDFKIGSLYEFAFDKIPNNIPEVYYKYLEKMNPCNYKVDNYLSSEEMFKVAETLAYLSLGKEFIPQDFDKTNAKKIIIETYPELKTVDFFKRLINNTIINEKVILGTYYVRFNLDPVAEYLGAEYYYKLHKKCNSLENFRTTVMNLPDDAKSFKNAFVQLCYCKE